MDANTCEWFAAELSWESEVIYSPVNTHTTHAAVHHLINNLRFRLFCFMFTQTSLLNRDQPGQMKKVFVCGARLRKYLWAMDGKIFPSFTSETDEESSLITLSAVHLHHVTFYTWTPNIFAPLTTPPSSPDHRLLMTLTLEHDQVSWCSLTTDVDPTLCCGHHISD